MSLRTPKTSLCNQLGRSLLEAPLSNFALASLFRSVSSVNIYTEINRYPLNLMVRGEEQRHVGLLLASISPIPIMNAQLAGCYPLHKNVNCDLLCQRFTFFLFFLLQTMFFSYTRDT